MNYQTVKLGSNKSFGIVFFIVFLLIAIWPLLSSNEILSNPIDFNSLNKFINSVLSGAFDVRKELTLALSKICFGLQIKSKLI